MSISEEAEASGHSTEEEPEDSEEEVKPWPKGGPACDYVIAYNRKKPTFISYINGNTTSNKDATISSNATFSSNATSNNDANHQSECSIVKLLKKHLEATGLSYHEVTSEKDHRFGPYRCHMVYILIKAPREVLIERAEDLRLSVTAPELKMVDVMADKADEDKDTHANNGTNSNDVTKTPERVVLQLDREGVKDRRKEMSRCEHFLEFAQDWFRPKLLLGFIKFDYKKKYDKDFFQIDPTADPFINNTRIRSFIVHDLINNIEISKDLKEEKNNEVDKDVEDNRHDYRGIGWMKKRGYVSKTFVPHSEQDKEKFYELRKEKNRYCSIQSVTSIREYFGEKVAYSFAWRSAWLSCCLTVPAILGILIFFVSVILSGVRENQSSNDSSSSNVTKPTEYGVFDNELLPIYAIVALLCQIIGFTIGWSKYKFIYGFKWGMLNYFLENERQCVINQKSTKDLKYERKLWSRIASHVMGIGALLGVTLLNFLVFFIQQILRAYLSTNEVVSDDWAYHISTVSVSFVNTIFVVLVLNRGFAWFAKWLCDKEYHTFPSDYERALTWKVFFYSFAANNLRLLMMSVVPRITFPFSIPRVNRPGDDFVMEFCEEGKCVSTITIQLLFFLLFKPLTTHLSYRWDDCWRLIKSCSKRDDLPQDTATRYRNLDSETCELLNLSETSELPKRLDTEYDLYESSRFGERNQSLMDMNNRVAQYAFVIMFGGVFPLSPLIAGVVEIIVKWLDVKRYMGYQRRSVPRRYEGVGCWEEIIDLVNILAMFTNVWIVVYRSTFMSQYSYPPELSIALLGSISFFVFQVRVMLQVTSIPEKVKRFHQAELELVSEHLATIYNKGGSAGVTGTLKRLNSSIRIKPKSRE